MFFKMCDEYGIKYKKTLTGFKNVGKAKIEFEEKYGKDGFIMAYEESCGYVVKDNLYDKELEIEFIKKIRDEKKFNSLEELQVQIKKDVEECLRL